MHEINPEGVFAELARVKRERDLAEKQYAAHIAECPNQAMEARAAEGERERDEALRALRRCEWLPDASGNLRCPECFGHAVHESGCQLRAALLPEKTEGK